MFGFSHGVAPTLRRAFQTQGVEHRSTKDKAEVGEELKALFPVEHTDMASLAAYENLRTFARRWGKKYPSLGRLDRERNAGYFTYLSFPESVRRMI